MELSPSNIDLIQLAASALAPHKSDNGRLHGDVGAAIVDENGKIFKGVCVDTPSWGLCAERSAMAAMITAGQYKFRKVVAVWRDEKKRLYVLPPCGVCRDFMVNVDKSNLKAEVVLGKTESKILSDLVPNHEWPQPLEV